MAIKLIGSYSKRLGLPAYSSHQFSVTIKTELTGLDDIAREAPTFTRPSNKASTSRSGNPASSRNHSPYTALKRGEALHGLFDSLVGLN